MTNNKKMLRQEALARRDRMRQEQRAVISQKLVDELQKLLAILKGKTVAGFWPIKSEIDPRPMMSALKKHGFKLALPAIIDKTTMVFRIFEDEGKLVDMGFGTVGPSEEAEIVEPETLLVPLSAFDSKGNRIGYGAGYYDRAIASMRENGHNPLLIGLAFDCQEVPSIPGEPYDQKLAMILTESGLRSF
ncbi:5-formyltetrahydrofolate cyclo-ligase [uncultured Bartonella sp.]|uniref:5-formyltetrahydrofolate cyclo-ligase n=1 Tax=uncultured Bartonella sp. TaxID=104108 RepID=UPI0025E9B853|nr:5-formyltetrahydrofolate cyclo-ligase [uncultured Bartonella sp.]